MPHTYCQECGFPIAQYGADVVPAEYAGRWFHLAPPDCDAQVPATDAAPSLLEALERVMDHARNPRGDVCLLCGWAVGHDHNAPCGNAIEIILAARGEVVPGA